MNAPLPEWLAPSSAPSPTATNVTRSAPRQLRQLQMDNLFENSIDRLTNGEALPVILRNDPRGITPGEFLRFALRDPERKRRYYDALAVGAEIVYSEVVAIADALDNPMEDVQRSKLRIDTRKWWASIANRNRFGDIKKLDITTQDITEDSLKTLTIDDLKRMVLSGEYRTERDDTIDVTPAP